MKLLPFYFMPGSDTETQYDSLCCVCFLFIYLQFVLKETFKATIYKIGSAFS